MLETEAHRALRGNQSSKKSGSGSLEQDGLVSIVAMKKKEQAGLVHYYRLGKRQRHAHKTSQTLAQRVLPALHMGRFARLFPYRRMLLLRDDRQVCRPEVCEAIPLTVG
jgi:hypothetical protein